MSRVVESYVVGLNDVLKALRKLPKDAQQELRQASGVIAERHMLPAWRDAARSDAGGWGEKIAGSMRVRKDRIPALSIGYAKKVYSGGASSNMVRYPANKGTRGRGGQHVRQFGTGTDWMEKVRPYQSQALREWGQAVDGIVRKWEAMP